MSSHPTRRDYSLSCASRTPFSFTPAPVPCTRCLASLSEATVQQATYSGLLICHSLSKSLWVSRSSFYGSIRHLVDSDFDLDNPPLFLQSPWERNPRCFISPFVSACNMKPAPILQSSLQGRDRLFLRRIKYKSRRNKSLSILSRWEGLTPVWKIWKFQGFGMFFEQVPMWRPGVPGTPLAVYESKHWLCLCLIPRKACAR